MYQELHKMTKSQRKKAFQTFGEKLFNLQQQFSITYQNQIKNYTQQ